MPWISSCPPFILTFSFFPLKKQRREVSINRPASYEPAALPLRHPAFYPSSPYSLLFPLSLFKTKIKNSIAGNRTRGANVRGLHVTNYTTMDY